MSKADLIAKAATLILATRAQLEVLVAASGLIPGQEYKMTDFRTRQVVLYGVPNVINGDVALGDDYTTPIEPLILTAATTNSFYPEVKSTLYPRDIIRYEFVDSTSDGVAAGYRGRITYREDPDKNIVFREDWRNTRVRRYDNNDGVFNKLSGPNWRDVFLFSVPSIVGDFANANLNAFPDIHDISVGKPLPNKALSYITFWLPQPDTFVRYLILEGSTHDIAFEGFAEDIRIEFANGNIRFKSGANHVHIGCCSDGTDIGQDCYNINVGQYSPHWAIADTVYNVSINNGKDGGSANHGPLVNPETNIGFPGVWPVTQAEYTAMKTAGELWIGQMYQITDNMPTTYVATSGSTDMLWQ